jgi:hypothetical protein
MDQMAVDVDEASAVILAVDYVVVDYLVLERLGHRGAFSRRLSLDYQDR